MSRLVPCTGLRKHSQFVPRHSAQVGYSQNTKVNTAGLEVNDKLVAYVTGFLVVCLKIHV